jgi:LacI family transcriptional regulator
MTKQRITMQDVALEAGVSLMTVSRVVNNKDGISDATRQRIQAIIDRLGYRPSDIARSLATDRTSTIGLVVIDNSNPFFSEIARGVEHEAYALGYNVFLCNTEEDTEREQAVLRSLEEKRVDGLILCSPRLDEASLRAALKSHSAVVLINRRLFERAEAVLQRPASRQRLSGRARRRRNYSPARMGTLLPADGRIWARRGLRSAHRPARTYCLVLL